MSSQELRGVLMAWLEVAAIPIDIAANAVNSMVVSTHIQSIINNAKEDLEKQKKIINELDPDLLKKVTEIFNKLNTQVNEARELSIIYSANKREKKHR